MMITTEKEGCRNLAALLAAHGIRRAVLSPGSRNAPLLVAFSREPRIKTYVVVDERTAAFMALGMARRLDEPVALVCTSGSALLNYAPAVSEAYYSRVPLLVVSADRQPEWIDQDDSQTIRQHGVLASIVKKYCSVPEITDPATRWYHNRLINDAVLAATAQPCGPVHINVPLGEPLCGLKEYVADDTPRTVAKLVPDEYLSDGAMAPFVRRISEVRKVMVVAAMSQPDEALNRALSRLAALPNVVVLTETIANLADGRFIPTIDRVLASVDRDDPAYAPDLLLTVGGALVSRMLKAYLREWHPEHWYVGVTDRVIDTMQSLSVQVAVSPDKFISRLADAVSGVEGEYSRLWKSKEAEAEAFHERYIADAPWCDLKAFSYILPAIPAGTALQLSNGTSIRYAQLFRCGQVSRCDANRGVCGIDGSTSTALGASCVDENMTLLITGDMSFAYDANGLSTAYNMPRFKVIVMCNGGGGIFRFIKGPSELDELESCFEVHRDLPAEKYADLYGFRFFKADSEASLVAQLPLFFDEKERPALLAVETPHELNSEILKGYFVRK